MQMLRLMLRRFRQSPFLSSVAILLSGSTAAQLVPLLAMPFLARLYTPEMFAAQALLVMISVIGTPLATGSYELAIASPRSTKRAAAIATVTLLLALAFGVLLLGLIGLGWGWLSTTSPLAPLKGWIVSGPVIIVAVATLNLCNYWLLRQGKLLQQSIDKVVLAVASAGLAILAGLMQWPGGLLMGVVVGHCLAALVALVFAWRAGLRFHLSRSYAMAIIHHYRQFPLFGSIPTVISNMAAQLPLMLIAAHFTSHQAGNYAVVRSLMSAGILLITSAVGQVMMKHIASCAQRRLPVWPYYRRVGIWLFAGSVVLAAGVFVLGPWFFKLYLGKGWEDVAWLARLLSLNIVLMVTGASLSFAALALRQVYVRALWQVAYGLLACVLFVCSKATFLQFIEALVALEMLAYLLYIAFTTWAVRQYDAHYAVKK